MISFFEGTEDQIYAVHIRKPLPEEDITKLKWLFDTKTLITANTITGFFMAQSGNDYSTE